MKKIKNKKSSPMQIKTPQSQITTLWISPVSTVLVGFFFFFVFFFLFLPQIGLSVSPPPFFPFLLSFFFFFFFLPLSWCLAFLNSLYLLILLKPKPKPICLKLLSQINGSLSLTFFCGFLCIWCCWLVMVRWRAWVCGDWHGGGLSLWISVVEGVGVDIEILWWIHNRLIVHGKIFAIKLISNRWRGQSANEIKPRGKIKWRKPYGSVRRKDLYGKFLLNEIPN